MLHTAKSWVSLASFFGSKHKIYQGIIVHRFITALTRGGPNGMPRPIEMNAHDPRRYIADMLAWVHQALASERDLIISLFGQDDHRDAAVSPNGLRSDLPSSNALLDRVMEGVCRPLKV